MVIVSYFTHSNQSCSGPSKWSHKGWSPFWVLEVFSYNMPINGVKITEHNIKHSFDGTVRSCLTSEIQIKSVFWILKFRFLHHRDDSKQRSNIGFGWWINIVSFRIISGALWFRSRLFANHNFTSVKWRVKYTESGAIFINIDECDFETLD